MRGGTGEGSTYRDVASFMKPPQGKIGRPSRAMTDREAAADALRIRAGTDDARTL